MQVTNESLQSKEVGGGCEEYLIEFRVFETMARRYGLVPVRAALDAQSDFFQSAAARESLEPAPPDRDGTRHDAFHFFKPSYGTSPEARELDSISRLYTSFVFCKVDLTPPAPTGGESQPPTLPGFSPPAKRLKTQPNGLS